MTAPPAYPDFAPDPTTGEVWGRIHLGDKLTYRGRTYKVVGLHVLPECANAVAFRLRCKTTGHTELALVSDVHADIIESRDSFQRAFQDPKPVLLPEHATRHSHPGSYPGPNAQLQYLGQPFDPSAGLAGQSDGRWELETPHIEPGNEPEENDNPIPTNTPRHISTTTHNRRWHLDRGALIETLPASATRKAEEKEAHVLEILTGHRSGDPGSPLPGEPRPEYTAETIGDRIDAKATELGCSFRTVRRWVDDYDSYGFFGVVDKRALRDLDPSAGLSEEIITAAIDQVRAEVDESTGRRRRFYWRLQKRLDEYYGPGVVTLPPRTTLMPKLERLLPGWTFKSAKRRRTQDLTPKDTFQSIQATRPGQVGLMDATPLDVRAYDPINDIDVSASLSLILDSATYSISSFRLVSGAENRADAVLLLADSLRPEATRPGWRRRLSARLLGLPESTLINHDARFAGAAALPVIYYSRIVADHAKINVSKAFVRACWVLRIHKSDARKLQPTDKHEVERLFETIGSQFSQWIAGYTGASVENRGKNVAGQARWTIDELEEFFAYWVVHIYQHTKTRALVNPLAPGEAISPNMMYAALVSLFGWVPAPVEDDMYFELLPIRWLSIQNDGVQVDYRQYDDDILRDYQGKSPAMYTAPLSAKGRRPGRSEGARLQGNLWPIRIDPNDIGVAYFYAPRERAWFELTWVGAPDPDMPMSDLFYRQVRAWMKEHGLDDTDPAEIAAAIDAFYERVGARETWTAKTKRQVSREQQRARAATRDRVAHARTVPVQMTGTGQPPQSQAAASAAAMGTAERGTDDGFDPARVPALRVVRNNDEGSTR